MPGSRGETGEVTTGASPAPARAPVDWTRGDWTRDDWTALADRMLASVRPFASPGHARILLPGPEGGYGRDVDGLEGFARTFLIAGFRIAGENGIAGERGVAGDRGIASKRGTGPDELADWYAAGIAAGTDPASPDRWVRLDEHPQAKVEAASIALILDMTRPWIWDRLDPAVRQRVIDYLSPAVGDPTYPRINWVWFRLVVQTFLRSVGGPWSAAEMAEDLATHDSLRRADGWLSDGPERAYDHYTGWALHLYPTLWARMAGAEDFAAGRRARDVAMLDRYLQDALALIGADGSPLIQGRSLTYRFAAAAPFWVGALAGVPSITPGQLRRAATGIVAHFVDHGAPDDRGLLTTGWHGAWPRLAQSYSGPGSPYWAGKGLLGIALSADHPVWAAGPEPLPVETGDTLRAVRAPGWLVAGTRADGIVRVVNHGTDHTVEGATIGDSPLYARLGYSTATSPVLDESGWDAPVDQSVVLIDGSGRSTHRAGLHPLTLRIDGAGPERLGVAGSTAAVHWVEPDRTRPDHGGGRAGESRPAGRITVFSLVRDVWEMRLARLDALADGVDPDAVRLRIGGWPVAGEGTDSVAAGTAIATGAALTSRVRSATGAGGHSPATPSAGVTTHEDGGPLGRPVRVPWLEYAARTGVWIPALIELSGGDRPPDRNACSVALGAKSSAQGSLEQDLDVRVTWPDGVRTHTRLTLHTLGTPSR